MAVKTLVIGVVVKAILALLFREDKEATQDGDSSDKHGSHEELKRVSQSEVSRVLHSLLQIESFVQLNARIGQLSQNLGEVQEGHSEAEGIESVHFVKLAVVVNYKESQWQIVQK